MTGINRAKLLLPTKLYHSPDLLYKRQTCDVHIQWSYHFKVLSNDNSESEWQLPFVRFNRSDTIYASWDFSNTSTALDPDFTLWMWVLILYDYNSCLKFIYFVKCFIGIWKIKSCFNKIWNVINIYEYLVHKLF